MNAESGKGTFVKLIDITRKVLCGVLALSCVTAWANVSVPATASFQLNGGSIDLAGSNLQIAGAFGVGAGIVIGASDIAILPGGSINAGSGVLTLSGDWSNLGSFNAGSSTVNFVDGASALSTVLGSSSFHDAHFLTAIGKTYAFEVASTQTIDGLLTIQGTASQPIQFKSTTAGQAAFINLLPGGNQAIDFVGVSNVHATGQQLAPTKTNQGGSGDDLGWFGHTGGGPGGAAAVPAPIRSPFALLLLALGLLGLAARFDPRRASHSR